MAPPPRKKLSIQKRSRSVPFPRPYIKATIFTSFFLLAVIALVTTVAAFFILQTQKSAYLVLAVLFATIFIWTISLFIRRSARCPLCQGTPYFGSGAHTHEKATKLPFLNFGMSNIVRTIANQTFRCMYCGQPYDFLKPVTNPPSGGTKKKEKEKKRTKTRKKRSSSSSR